MKRFANIITALLLALLTLAGLSACSRKEPKKEDAGYTLTAKEEAKVLELARAFRIYGDFDIERVFPASKTENMIFSLYTAALPESDTRGYGKVAIKETDELVKRMLGFDATALVRTKFKPTEVQLIYTVGDNYYVFLTDDSGYSYEISSAELLPDESGARKGVKANVRITGPEGAFSIVLTLRDDDKFVFTVLKSEVQFFE